MKLSEKEKMQAWIQFASGALAGIASLNDGKIESECEIATEYADEMLKNLEYTFEGDDDE